MKKKIRTMQEHPDENSFHQRRAVPEKEMENQSRGLPEKIEMLYNKAA